jgi:hypothetical protein
MAELGVAQSVALDALPSIEKRARLPRLEVEETPRDASTAIPTSEPG